MVHTDPFANPRLRGENTDFDNGVVSFDPSVMTPDLLFDLAQEVKSGKAESLGDRILIEHSHAVNHDDYIPMFTKDELTRIAMTLVVTRIVREMSGEPDRVELIETFGKAFVDEFEDGPVLPVDEGPLSRVEVLDDSDKIRVFDVLTGDQPAQFKSEAIEAARRGVTIE